MSDDRILIRRSLCWNFAHYCQWIHLYKKKPGQTTGLVTSALLAVCRTEQYCTMTVEIMQNEGVVECDAHSGQSLSCRHDNSCMYIL